MNDEKIILFVDDERNILSSLMRGLKKWLRAENLIGMTAASVHEAMQIIRDNLDRIAVIVSDQKMPDLKGSGFSRIIHSKYPDITVIILSGHSDMKDMAEMIQSGVFTFIEKPWEQKSLQNEIRKGLEMYNLKREVRIERDRRTTELCLAGEFQQSILKTTIPASDRIKFEVTYEPVSETGLGGDYYDFYELENNRFIILTGDTAGRGMRSAFITAAFKSVIYPDYLKNIHNLPFSPAHFLNWLNNRIIDFLKDSPDLLISFSATVIDLDLRSVVTANAGQPPLFVIQKNHAERLGSDGPVLGLKKNISFQDSGMEITAGDRILICTDGIYTKIDRTEASFSERFINILEQSFSENGNHNRFLAELSSTAATCKWEDDITVITALIR